MPSKKNINRKPRVKEPKTAAKKTIKKAAVETKTAKTLVNKKADVKTKVNVLKAKKTVGLTVSILNTKGQTVGRTELPSEIFAAKINNSLMSQAVRVYLANQRQGTSKTKDRGEVDRTTKKVWQQKGTGRARHGSRRAPIFVGGGVAFGPKPRDFSLKLAKKMKTLALFSALSSKLKDNQIKVIKGLETISPKTKMMVQVLHNLKIDTVAKILLITPKSGKESESIYRASRNIKGVEILTANLINTYKVLDNTMILLMKDSIESLKVTFIKH